MEGRKRTAKKGNGSARNGTHQCAAQRAAQHRDDPSSDSHVCAASCQAPTDLLYLRLCHHPHRTQQRVPIVHIIFPRPTAEVVPESTNGNADGEQETPIVVPIASWTRPPSAKSALRKNTSRKRPASDVDGDDEAADAKKQKLNAHEAEVDVATPMVIDTTEMADDEAYEDPQIPGAFEVAAPKPKPAPQPAQAQAGRKRPASDYLEQDQRKRRKHSKVDLAPPAAHEEVTAVDVEMGDDDEPQQQQQQLMVSNGPRKSKRASLVHGKKKKPVQEDAAVSTDPLCQRRRIGSEWEIVNRRFKIGPDGKRLLLAPLRTRRKKYEMVRFSFSRLSVAYWLFLHYLCAAY